MKKTILNLVIISFSFLLFSCGSNTPASSAESFFKYMYSGDFESAKKYATTNTKSMLTMMESFGGKDQLEDQMKGIDFNYKVIKTKIDGDKAICTMEVSKDGKTETMPVNLVNKNGKWLVDFNKEDTNKENGMDKEGMKPSEK
jgi:hypothetical protein